MVTAPVLAKQSPPPPPLESPEYSKVSLVEVKEIKFQAVAGAPPLDSNPGPGGTVPAAGARILAEARDPIEIDPSQPIYDRVNVVATIEPPVPDPGTQGSVKVYFRPLDVDDPAPQGLIDDETKLYDNRGQEPTGTLTDANGVEVGGGAVVEIPAPGAAVQTTFRVSLRQGDNYRVGASTDSTWPTQLSVVTGSQTGEVVHAIDATLPDGVQLSEMLTVWRTLHLELDRMDPTVAPAITQQDLDVEKSWTDLASGKLTDKVADFKKLITPNGVLPKGAKNLWKGADLNPNASAGQDFRVNGNGGTTLSTQSGDMCSVVPAGFCKKTPPNPVDRMYYLRDDKLTSLTTVAHDVGPLELALREIYVRVSPQPAPSPRVFIRNLTPAQLEAMSGSVTNSPVYWHVPALLAFEGEIGSDHDPSENESWGSGRTGATTHPVAATYLETIADVDATNTSCRRSMVPLPDYISGTIAHEVMHALTLGHDGDHTGALMCAELKNDINEPHRSEITQAQKAILRGIVQPRADLTINDTCPTRACP